ncbi:MAG: hypothetical protein VXA00_10140, partial [Rhodospirillales bacterium]
MTLQQCEKPADAEPIGCDKPTLQQGPFSPPPILDTTSTARLMSARLSDSFLFVFTRLAWWQLFDAQPTNRDGLRGRCNG